MKILNLGKIKKIINTIIRKGGWINYKFKLIPVNGVFPTIYRDFKRQKLFGSLYIDGNRIYRICENN